jgi:hypothetical protein
MKTTSLNKSNLSLIAALALAGPVSAATIWVDGVDNNWNTAGNWSDGVPSGGETVTIGDGFTVNAPSTVNLATFDLKLQGTLNFGSGANYEAGGSITVSGSGQLNGVPNAFIAPSYGTTTFNLDGDSAQISNFAQIGSFNGFTTVNWNLTPGETGINPIAATGFDLFANGTDNLTVDLTGYDIANGDSMTLFTYPDLEGVFESVVINGQSIGSNLGDVSTTSFSTVLADNSIWTGDLVITSSSVSLANLTFVPEPSSTALLGLGGLALMLRRRR